VHRIPRDVSTDELIRKLKKYNYLVVRQRGSHIRLESNTMKTKHYITLPHTSALKVGTLNFILKEISEYLKKSKNQLIKELFYQKD
jgi:predicted RNA binding protein YcfA (HicA-like mRNA interferase family)